MPLPPEEQRKFNKIVSSNHKFNGVKTMITIYEKRGMAKGLAKGRAEGKAEGRAEGKVLWALIGRIQVVQNLLGQEVTPSAELEAKTLTALKRMAAALERRLRR
jgi:flagellar biosynthesis/type III secretory pathway protein FliH